MGYDYRGRPSGSWREHIIGKVRSFNHTDSMQSSEFVINNLIRYIEQDKKLSAEGYETLRQNWDVIDYNSRHTREQKNTARNYLMKEGYRLNECHKEKGGLLGKLFGKVSLGSGILKNRIEKYRANRLSEAGGRR